MEYADVISLGWEDRNPENKNEHTKTFIYEADGFDYHIMSVGFGCGDDTSFDLIMINCVPQETVSNIWENSETHFYGEIKTKQELDITMQLVGVTQYRGL